MRVKLGRMLYVMNRQACEALSGALDDVHTTWGDGTGDALARLRDDLRAALYGGKTLVELFGSGEERPESEADGEVSREASSAVAAGDKDAERAEGSPAAAPFAPMPQNVATALAADEDCAEVGGRRYAAVPRRDAAKPCKGCAAYAGDGCFNTELCNALPPCQARDRADGRNVVFEEVAHG
jgi:hypothetical protein